MLTGSVKLLIPRYLTATFHYLYLSRYKRFHYLPYIYLCLLIVISSLAARVTLTVAAALRYEEPSCHAP